MLHAARNENNIISLQIYTFFEEKCFWFVAYIESQHLGTHSFWTLLYIFLFRNILTLMCSFSSGPILPPLKK